MSVEMTPCQCHLNHLICSTPALGMGGAERLRRHGSGRSGREQDAVARDRPVHPKVRTPYAHHCTVHSIHHVYLLYCTLSTTD